MEKSMQAPGQILFHEKWLLAGLHELDYDRRCISYGWLQARAFQTAAVISCVCPSLVDGDAWVPGHVVTF